jgi:hypothetical protein|tara:strand:+ start:29 stop:352 length:324 start_codon:yes stop_codon:yes gene_type:complete
MNTPTKNSNTDQTKNKRYVFAQKTGADYTAIKLLDPKYSNVIYKYGKVRFAKEEKADGTLPMKFDYDILSNPESKDIDNQEFIDFIGDILIEVMEQQLNDGKVEFGE